MTDRSLDTALNDPNNSFSAVRLGAAIAVVVSHSFLLVAGTGTADPLAWASYNLGQVAVNVFFFLSGMLLARSLHLNTDIVRFFAARILRIFPALLTSGLVVAWLIAPFGTSHYFNGYLSDPRTIFYPLAAAITFENAGLTDVFVTGSRSGEINLPLWTVKYELLSYLALGLAAALGFLRGRRSALAALALFLLLFLLVDTNVQDGTVIGSILRFGVCFLLGILTFHFAAWIIPNLLLAAALLAISVGADDTFAGPTLSILAYCYLALWVGCRTSTPVTGATNAADLSFGLYLYAWPVQQALLPVVLQTGVGVAGHLAASLVVAGGLALFSWTIIEKPALVLKGRFSRPAAQSSN